MNKAELISAVAGQVEGLTKADAEKAVKAMLESISGELENGNSVTLIGFGTFSVAERSARTAKNPQTGEEMKVPAKTVAKFKPGKALAERVNK